MFIKVIGIGENNERYEAIVEGKSLEDVRTDLIECMGIEAHSKEVFNNELLDIGYAVVTKAGSNIDINKLPTIEIPINLASDEDIF